jgi:hypothetical protein
MFAPPLHTPSASPRIPTPLPQMSIGMVTGTVTWLPEPTPDRPSVVPLSSPVPPVALAPPSHDASALPTALPHAFTGAVTGTLTWLPDSTPCPPDVVPPGESGVLAVAPPVHADAAPPRRPTELPQALAGAVTGTSTWLPEAMPDSPDVMSPDPCGSAVGEAVPCL